MIGLLFVAALASTRINPLNTDQLSKIAFGTDAAWYKKNIPFFDCSDPQIQEIYYYRWKLYHAHIRDVGERGTVITEFLDDVGWQKWPFASLNDATPFHIREGRWLRDPNPVNEYIDYLYVGGGNDRHFAEGIADATYQNCLARGDLKFAEKYLPAMRHIYNLWDDHYDFSKGLYFIEPLLDATEYTISSIDASGGKDGFRGGDAFRPTINAYQYGNAKAIARLAELVHDDRTAKEFSRRAQELKHTVQDQLWSLKLDHFIDRYQRTNEFVQYWEPIRGRELAGYVPWAYGLPDDTPSYAEAWRHILKPNELEGPFGLRTVEPTYQYYMRQYRYLGNQPECQWNGPSWPFQTTQVLTGLANLLNDYHQEVVNAADYLRLLRQYTDQHYLNGKPNLQEDYNADLGKPIVGLDRSHHYNHSGYVDLIVTGLCGLRPQEGDSLIINPLFPRSGGLSYFCLQDVPYHGHSVTIAWDEEGKRYGFGKGLTVFVDGKRSFSGKSLGRYEIPIGKPITDVPVKKFDSALNVMRVGYPKVSASVHADTAWQAVDGRSWFFPEMPRGWATGTGPATDWLEIDYGRPTQVSNVNLSFMEAGQDVTPPSVDVQIYNGAHWETVTTVHPVPNGPTLSKFPQRTTTKLRVSFSHSAPARLVELQTFEK